MRASIAWLCIVLGLGFGSAALADTPSGLYVTGRGEVTKEPDLARFTFEVVRQGTDATALKQDVDRVTGVVVALAEKLGVKRDDITAAVIQVRPEYRYLDGRSVLEGINVSRTVRVTLKDLRHYGELTDGAIAAGVNQLQNVELDFADRTGLEQQALDAAIDHAKDEAAHVAGRLSMKLGRVLEVQLQDTGGGAPIPLGMAAAKVADANTFRPGSLRVERQVQVRYELVVP
jgi:uncharacterized protein YggE